MLSKGELMLLKCEIMLLAHPNSTEKLHWMYSEKTVPDPALDTDR